MSDKAIADLSVFENYLDGTGTEWNTLPRKLISVMDECLKRTARVLSTRPAEYCKFVLLRALETIETVFFILLTYTGNDRLSLHHAERAAVLYTEFMEQIGQDANHFLGLSSRDATMFVFKKTIYEIEPQIRKDWKQTDPVVGDHLSWLKRVMSIHRKVVSSIIVNDRSHNMLLYTDSANSGIIQRCVETCASLSRVRNKTIIRNRIAVIDIIVDTWIASENRIPPMDFFTLVEAVARKLMKSKMKTIVDQYKNDTDVEKSLTSLALYAGEDILNESKLMRLIRV